MKDTFWNEEVRELLRVRPGFALSEVDPDATPGTKGDKADGKKQLANAASELRGLQEKLFAQSRLGATDSVLVVLQAMDAAGKGGIVNHVFSQVEPYGLMLTAFKAPTEEERKHDFLWRIEPRVPKPGVIGLFDRSHYEDVLIQKVREFAPPEEIERRYGAINDFEKRVTDAGVRVVKIMLHISPEEQAERLLNRLNEPDKHWKYNPGDVDERALWPEYMDAFQTVFERTNTDYAPWYVVPANAKWYARTAVQQIVIDELNKIDPQWPDADFDVETERRKVQDTRELSWP